jgi:hypothetical protein
LSKKAIFIYDLTIYDLQFITNIPLAAYGSEANIPIYRDRLLLTAHSLLLTAYSLLLAAYRLPFTNYRLQITKDLARIIFMQFYCIFVR